MPQLGDQITESVFHATGTPDAGNILSLAFGAALWLMIHGVVTEETGRPEAGAIATLAAAIGLYPAAWYVTAGPHPLGDLATFTALAALVFRKYDAGDLAPVLAAACAASTKISLVPLGAVITVIVVARSRGRALGMAAGIWLLVLGPLVGWTYLHTGSPFGAAFAEWFSGSIYLPTVLERIKGSRESGQVGIGAALYGAAPRIERIGAGPDGVGRCAGQQLTPAADRHAAGADRLAAAPRVPLPRRPGVRVARRRRDCRRPPSHPLGRCGVRAPADALAGRGRSTMRALWRLRRWV